MTPDDLQLTPRLQEQLQGGLASAGIPNGLEQCITECAATVARYVVGHTFTATETDGWTRTLAVHMAFVRAHFGVPKEKADAAEAVMTELRAIRDGKFRLAESTESPARLPGAAVTEDSDLDGALR
jgi:hypothetical protein